MMAPLPHLVDLTPLGREVAEKLAEFDEMLPATGKKPTTRHKGP